MAEESLADSAPLLLVADDEQGFVMPLRDNLELEGYRVEVATDGEQALDKALALRPDLLLLDVMMPGRDGFEVCRELQRRGARIPILILSARDQEVDIVLGLELGADDYLTKPFGLRELLARIKAILRRQARLKMSARSDAGPVRIGQAEVDFARYEVRRQGRTVQLTPRELAVLRHLFDRRGAVVSRDELLDEVWGYDRYPTTRTVDNHMVRIRKAIERDPARPELLLSVRGVGYRLIPG
ncbi:MAG: response regulator transcription factor [Deltaproteobacteria bacterium]|nr:response regulator transcription factor [Deltaproteobacteria bacterium]